MPISSKKEKHKKAMSVEGKERWKSEKYRIKMSKAFGKSVIATNISTRQKLTFFSRKQAGTTLSIDEGSIGKVIKGHRKQAGGWSFENANQF